MSKKLGPMLVALALSRVQAYPGILIPNHLNPVHSLFVKPSGDGSTGDLYVAATEENGAKSQWLTDQPVSFLPGQALPTYPFSSVPRDESVAATQKRAVVASPTFKYPYGLPATPSDGNNGVVPYTYATGVPTAQPVPSEGNKECPSGLVAHAYPQYQYQSPFHYYYPQMMAAFASAINELKDAGVNESDANSLISQIMPQTTPVWPTTYAYPQYPVQYVMVDPATWAQTQAALASTTTQPPTTTTTADDVTASDNSEESV